MPHGCGARARLELPLWGPAGVTLPAAAALPITRLPGLTVAALLPALPLWLALLPVALLPTAVRLLAVSGLLLVLLLVWSEGLPVLGLPLLGLPVLRLPVARWLESTHAHAHAHAHAAGHRGSDVIHAPGLTIYKYSLKLVVRDASNGEFKLLCAAGLPGRHDKGVGIDGLSVDVLLGSLNSGGEINVALLKQPRVACAWCGLSIWASATKAKPQTDSTRTQSSNL